MSVENLYSCTTDNGSNMLKAAELLQDGISYFQMAEDDGPNFNAEEFNSNCLSLSIRCSAHTLQLVVSDVLLKMNEFRQPIEKIRTTVGKLRIPRYARIFKKHKKVKPSIDNVTRWSSTFYMIISVLREEDFIKSLKTIQNTDFFDDLQWDFMKSFKEAFGVIEIATRKLQENSLTFGDFYKVWIELNFQLHDLIENNIFSSHLISKMKEREQKLFENDQFLAAIYLDQRFNFLNSTYFNPEQKNRAIVCLMLRFEFDLRIKML